MLGRHADSPAKLGVEAEQHFTQPPPRYSEASLVKRLEELGIGRPSTYASTIQTLRDREYVRMEKNRFFAEHCALFHNRPFVWHIWDGRKKDGFGVLVHYHRLAAPNGEGRRLLEKVTHGYLGDWIARQRDEVKADKSGAEARLAAALDLQKKLEAILEGEPPYDYIEEMEFDGTRRPVSFPDHLKLLEDQIREKKVGLVIIDPIMAYLSGGIDSAVLVCVSLHHALRLRWQFVFCKSNIAILVVSQKLSRGLLRVAGAAGRQTWSAAPGAGTKLVSSIRHRRGEFLRRDSVVILIHSL